MLAARPEVWGDVIIARKETPTSYHLAVVVDDALQGVTEVVRGQDLFWSTGVHRLLQQLLGLPQPSIGIIASFGTPPGKNCRNQRLPRPAGLKAAGRDSAEVRRRVGLA